MRGWLGKSDPSLSFCPESGLYGGQSSGTMLLFARKSRKTLATCGGALPFCKISCRCCTRGTATGRRISSLYFTAVILPILILRVRNASPDYNGVTPYLSRSSTQASSKCSPRCQYNRCRPSGRIRMKRVSSVKRSFFTASLEITRVHGLLNNHTTQPMCLTQGRTIIRTAA